MAKLVVLGGTGYAGVALVEEAARRGFEVVSLSRSRPAVPVNGVEYIEGSVLDSGVVDAALRGVDVIVGALSPRGDMAGKVASIYAEVAQKAAAVNARFFVVGGFGSLKTEQGGTRIVEGEDFPDDYREEARELASTLDHLLTDAPETLDWLYTSPAATFGRFNPGERRGVYELAGDIATFDENGASELSSQDLAVAIIDEVVEPAHHRTHISVRY